MPRGLMRRHFASIDDLPITEARPFRWPLGRWPDDHRGLRELGLRAASRPQAAPSDTSTAAVASVASSAAP